MIKVKEEILENHCYTDLVYQRINKKLSTNLSNKEIEILMQKVLNETDLDCYQKIGKNYYISNKKQKIKITINSNTFRIITVDKLIK
ncbi:DUF3781 domain-containing protein [uncultured Polaribacter sp.]|uniref:DUF3781 domain-containing protein n=1 Tax=uncultured Polaribacter sp. TaxID=174711 RepID=UPI0030DD8A79|tara:strand:- start:1695 stop:1955 length:261 start_codon:yes stop_codon:yes gene_type:complete